MGYNRVSSMQRGQILPQCFKGINPNAPPGMSPMFKFLSEHMENEDLMNQILSAVMGAK